MYRNTPLVGEPLPIDPVLPQVLQKLRDCPAVVLQAPPGAGKTTRVPLALLADPTVASGRIVMLEPRRLAAAQAAMRMATVLGEDVGGRIGYTIRFERRVSPLTRVEVVTEGVLTRRVQHAPDLEGVSVVIFDEFHERSLQGDLALALCLEVQRELRPDLKLLVMSATLDCEPIAALLGGAPVITAAGQAFPVTIHYRDEPDSGRLPQRMAAAVHRALKEVAGDVLAFLPGVGEIRACQELLQESLPQNGVAVCPLYGDLPFSQQQTAMQPGAQRRVVLATNIAETSLTIDGVRVVLDSGFSRLLRYDPASGMNRLVTLRESRASAEQRAGRAGRQAPGVCYRLFSRHTFGALTGFTPPEITVADLATLVLELAVWGVQDVSSLSWLDVPPVQSLAAARGLLEMLGALDGHGRPTELGRQMAELPVHPRIARMLLRGRDMGLIQPACLLAALLSERDIFHYRPGQHASLCDSDVLERWEALLRNHGPDGRLHGGAVRGIERTAGQLARLMGVPWAGLPAADSSADQVARLLLAAYPDRVAMAREGDDHRYLLANGRGALLSARSGVRGALLLAVQVDAGSHGDGRIHLASRLTVDVVRDECGHHLVNQRQVVWDAVQERISAGEEECLGAVILSRRPVTARDDEAIPLLLEVIGNSTMQILNWGKDVQRFLGRARLVRAAYPEEDWPELTEAWLLANRDRWLGPFLHGLRSRRDLAALNLLNPLSALLSRQQIRHLDERAPLQITVPSGNAIAIDYVSSGEPVLAVKLQELFGLADTPAIASGRIPLLVHLLSPAGRPVQVTKDLRGFWETGYREVRRELKGRYPKHPWPENPWQFQPTHKTTRMLKKSS